jgi:hypothetical protein
MGDEEPGTTEHGRPRVVPATEAPSFPVTPPERATPLDEDEPERVVPARTLWAMKDRRHEQWSHAFGHADRIRARIGHDDAAVFAIDDGSHHVMLGRPVGVAPDGCVYSLVTRVAVATYHSLVAGAIDARIAFERGTDAGLSGAVEADGVANVFDVDYYGDGESIPERYLPPAPFIEFGEDLPSAEA